MKRLFTILFSLMLTVTLLAQNDVTTFLGIPVDGTKTAFIQKLKAKGFVSTSMSGSDLQGKFNGKDVYVIVQTNNNKVCRIVVTEKDKTRDESDIIIKFNRLLGQFRSNSKYVELVPNEEIEDGTDVSYQMRIKNKRFQAEFYQKPEKMDESDAEKAVSLQDKAKKAQELGDYSAIGELFADAKGLLEKYFQKKLVWFMITEVYGQYSIAIFYENGYNMANGEDL